MKRRSLTTVGNLFRRFSRWTPLLVLILVSLFSLLAAWLVGRLTAQQQEARFNREIAAHTAALQSRIADYGNLLIASRAFWLSQPLTPTETQFNAFTGTLDLPSRYPDVQALGFVKWQSSAVVGFGGVTVFPQQTNQPYRAVIRYIAPQTPVNLRALGFDMYSEPNRRAALRAGRTQGGLQATRPVVLVQEGAGGQQQPGFLLMLPVWRADSGGEALPNQGTLDGFVYLAIRGNTFVQQLRRSFGHDQLDARLSIGGVPLQSRVEPLRGGQMQPPLSLAGQAWQAEYAPPRQFREDPLNWLGPVTALLGLFAAGVAFSLLRDQVAARELTEEINEHLREAQRRQQRARAEFEAIFQAMQDAAAFTDTSGRVRLVNRAMTEQFGTPSDELVGQALTALHLDRRLDDRSTFQAMTTPYQRQDGSHFYGETQRNEVNDAQGNQLGYLEVIRDVSERVSADRKVRREQQRSQAVLDAIPQVLWVSDQEGQATYVNIEHRQRLGHAEVHQQLSELDREIYQEMWRRAHRCQSVASCVVRLRVRTADVVEERWFELRVAPLFDENGETHEWVASASDIHDRLLAEQSAQSSEARYRVILEGMPQIVWLASNDGQFTYFNQRWQEFVGQPGHDLIASLHPDDRQDYQGRWRHALATGQGFEAEHRLRSASGEYRTFVTRGLPIRGPQGQVTEWVGTMTDVDDSVYAENAARLLVDVTEALIARAGDPLASRQERYRAVLDLMTGQMMEAGAIWSVREDPQAPAGALPQLEELAASARHPHWELPHLMHTVEQFARRTAAREEPEYVTVHPLLHAVEVSGGLMYPMISPDGTVRGVLGLAHRHPLRDRDHELIQELVSRLTTALENDALRTQTIQAQHELRQLNQSLEERVQRRTLELEEANRELEAFSYSVSHDLRTPLRHIVGFGDLLRKDAAEQLSPKSQRYLGVITDAAGRMSGLIDSLLEFSRMGRQPLRVVPVALDELAQRIWDTLEPDRQGRNVQFDLHPLPEVSGDPALLELVFQNLLSNALKYSRTRDEAKIDVSAEITGNMVRVAVRDNGVGFDPKYTSKLFGVFQRLHRSEEFEGIGIGLANVRRIVNRHGGQVSAESEPGAGATFCISLPLNPEVSP